ncbi:MAG TPA: hypothetical protein VKU44_06525, partial [Terriglobia bacterium]|nr:hypothetical protein [Terriglobia bacterium]
MGSSLASRGYRFGGLTTLSLSGPAASQEPVPPLRAFQRDPQISVTDVWLERLPAAHSGLRIVHLTDIHHSLFTRLERVERAVHLSNRLRADVVALTGDYVTL